MSGYKLNTSSRPHLFVGLITGLWLVIFLVVIAPFDIAELTLINRIELMPPYGLIFLIIYILVIPIQREMKNYTGKWTWYMEATIIMLIFLLCLCLMYLYYKSSWVNGDYNFTAFTTRIFIPILIILSMILIFARWYVSKGEERQKENRILLRGDNKKDVLQLDRDSILCISGAQNYVEIHYLQNETMQKKLLRTTLRKIATQTPHLIQVHRSHLVNPSHFIQWSGSKTIILGSLEVPVSDNFKQDLDLHFNSVPNK